MFLKVGTFDDPSLFGLPQMAICTGELHAFHQVPDGVPTYEAGPS